MNLGTLVCTNYRYEIDLHGPQYYARRVCLQELLDVRINFYLHQLFKVYSFCNTILMAIRQIRHLYVIGASRDIGQPVVEWELGTY